MLLRELFQRKPSVVLLEANTRGGKHVLSQPTLVAGIAASARGDSTIPLTLRTKFRKMPDEDVANWFVDQVEALEADGWNGVRFSQDGQYLNWIANNYAQSRDAWEDIDGELAVAVTYFTTLKNRRWPADHPKAGQPMLDPRHSDIGAFKGVKELHRYMIVHYKDMLDAITKKAQEQAAEKWFRENARSVLLADTPEYNLYLLQNWAAAFIHGKGCAFCTFNSRSDYQFQHYSKSSPLFGLVPKLLPRIQQGDKNTGANILQKFQFDPGTHSFKDYLDYQAKPAVIKELFPYLFDDLVKGLRANKEEIENPEGEMVKGSGPKGGNGSSSPSIVTPTANGAPMQKKEYNVETVIGQLRQHLGEYWTNKHRPAEEVPPEQAQGDQAAPPAAPQA